MVLYLQVRATPGDVEMPTMRSLKTNVVAPPVCSVGLTQADSSFHWSPISLLRREVIEMCHKGAGITWYESGCWWGKREIVWFCVKTGCRAQPGTYTVVTGGS